MNETLQKCLFKREEVGGVEKGARYEKENENIPFKFHSIPFLQVLVLAITEIQIPLHKY